MSARAKILLRYLPDLVVVLVVIGGIHLYRTQDMLAAADEVAPALLLATLDGRTGGLAQTAGRTTLVYFFAPWCKVCGASAHNLRNLQRLRGERNLAVLLVALDWQSVAEVRDYVRRHELDATVLLGSPDTARRWGVSVFPTCYFIDPAGRVVHRDYGYSTLAGLWLRSVLAG